MKRFILKAICIAVFFTFIGAITQKIDALFQPNEPEFIVAQNQLDDRKVQFKIIRNISTIPATPAENRQLQRARLRFSSPKKAFAVDIFRITSPNETKFIAEKKITVFKTLSDPAINEKTTTIE